MTGQFEGKVALVTGGNSGIGRATAIQFAREGAKVVIAARRVPEGEETEQMIRDAGGDATFVQTDVSNAADAEAMVAKTVEIYGRLDCAFNNAGVISHDSGRTHEHSEEEWDRIIDINLKGVWLCMKYEITQMLKQGGGAIVNDSSTDGLIGSFDGAAYIASKHGVVGLTKTAALEYAQQSIRVNAVCPGFILTPMSSVVNDPAKEPESLAKIPLGRIGAPEEIAEAVIWLCSDAASFVTGHAMSVDGGEVVG